MSSHAATGQQSLYYLYMQSEWSGPYQVSDIRSMVQKGEVPKDTYAYDSANQQHHTVEDVIAQPAAGQTSGSSLNKPSVGAARITDQSAQRLTVTLDDDVVDIAPAQTAATFDRVLPELKSFYVTYLALSEHTSSDQQQSLNSLRHAHQALQETLSSTTGPALGKLVNDIDEIGDYLANRHQITQLWQLVGDLEKLDHSAKPQDTAQAAKAVLSCLFERAERHKPNKATSTVLLDVGDLEEDEHDSVATRKILLHSARDEVQNTKKDMDALHHSYTQLQEQHAKDLDQARKLLEKAESARTEERHTARQTAAEVRALAAEIHRLASEPDIAESGDEALMAQVAQLGGELQTADVSTLAYVAEDVLIRLISHLRSYATSGGGGDLAPMREELAKARSLLADARTQVAMLTNERDALKKEYEQQRLTAERASERAREREHRLRSTVTALEVTKELHQEVMKDLQVQLGDAQTRVEAMEQDLTSVRGELKVGGEAEERGEALQHEMQRMIEMKTMLQVRQSELSVSLKSAEAELAKAESSSGGNPDLTEALAAKVNHLRQTFETTQKRLLEQEDVATRLTSDLEASRREASELRSRSDGLNNELTEARTGLSLAKKRVEELDSAYERLEAEREALKNELIQRKTTDTIHRDANQTADTTDLDERLDEATRTAESLGVQLASERRKVIALAEAQVAAQARIEELSAERNELRRRFDALQSEHINDHARHTAAIAVSTQAAIASEHRLKEAMARVTELESLIADHPGETLEPTTSRSEATALERVSADELRQQLAAAQAEADRLRSSTVKPPVANPSTAITARLAEVERALLHAVATRDEIKVQLDQTTSERDRLRRELDRLRNEHEAAAVEHRTALKSARDRLSESQEHVATLEQELATARTSKADSATTAVAQERLSRSLSEQERLSAEVKRLTGELERVHSASPALRDQQLIELTKASHQLASEQEKVLALNRSLVETLQAAETARNRTIELQTQIAARTTERDELHLICERLRGELAAIRLQSSGADGGKALAEAFASRDKALVELEHINSELADLRNRLTSGERETSVGESAKAEKGRIKLLEVQLAELHRQQQNHEQMFNEARARLVLVSSERDRLASELATLHARPDFGVELKRLRKRLVRAKERIRELRVERDQALAEGERSANNAHELSTQIERLRAAQRAAAEALGVPMQGAGDAGFSTRQLGVALQPLTAAPGEAAGEISSLSHPAVRGFTSRIALTNHAAPPKALTRRLMQDKPPQLGFTSAFGRPAIPMPSATQPATMGHTPMSLPQSQAPITRSRHRHQRWWLAIPATGILALLGTALMSPLIPYSTQGVVNARISAVLSPIDGNLVSLMPGKGERLARDQEVVVVRNEHLDTSGADGLRIKRADVLAHQNTLEGKLTELERERTRCEREIADVRVQLERIANEAAHPSAPTSTTASNPAQQPAELQASKVSELEAALTLRVSDLGQRIADLRPQVEADTNELREIDAALRAEEARLARLREARLSSPINGMVWKCLAENGQFVKAGATVAELTDPSSVVVEALLDARHRNSLTIGDRALVQLMGTGRQVEGTIRDIRRSESLVGEGRMAYDLSAVGDGGFKIHIELDQAPNAGQIGGGARVLVTGSDPGMAKRLLIWWYAKTRM